MELTLQQLQQFETYLLQEEKSKATIEKYMRDVHAFYHFIKDTIISKEVALQYKQQLLDSYKSTSINSMLASINALFDFLQVPQFRVKVVKTQKQLLVDENKELTKQEYQRLLKVAKKKEKIYLLVQTITNTGIRVSEHRYITVEALQRGKATIRNKGKVRDIVLSKELIKKLTIYCKEKQIKEGSIFITKTGKPLDRSNIWKMMKQLCKEARVERSKVFPHNLRHLFAFTFYSIEKDIARLADVLGHSSIETTRIYIKTNHYRFEKVFIKMKLLDE